MSLIHFFRYSSLAVALFLVSSCCSKKIERPPIERTVPKPKQLIKADPVKAPPHRPNDIKVTLQEGAFEINGQYLLARDLTPSVFYDYFKNYKSIVSRNTILKKPTLIVQAVTLPSSLTPEKAETLKDLIVINDQDSGIVYRAVTQKVNEELMVRQSISIPNLPGKSIAFSPPLPVRRKGTMSVSELEYTYIVELFGPKQEQRADNQQTDTLTHIWRMKDDKGTYLSANVFDLRITMYAIPYLDSDIDVQNEKVLGSDLKAVRDDYVIPTDNELMKMYLNEELPDKMIFVSENLFNDISSRYAMQYPGEDLWRHQRFVAIVPTLIGDVSFNRDMTLDEFKQFPLNEELMSELEKAYGR
ncbi:MAG: hypothetical protein ABIH86_01815 [Planctomycetota bacterium]